MHCLIAHQATQHHDQTHLRNQTAIRKPNEVKTPSATFRRLWTATFYTVATRGRPNFKNSPNPTLALLFLAAMYNIYPIHLPLFTPKDIPVLHTILDYSTKFVAVLARHILRHGLESALGSSIFAWVWYANQCLIAIAGFP